MTRSITKQLRILRNIHGVDNILDKESLSRILSSSTLNCNIASFKLVLAVLDEGFPRLMLAGKKDRKILLDWADDVASRYGVSNHAAFNALNSWRKLLFIKRPVRIDHVQWHRLDYDTCLAAVIDNGYAITKIPAYLIDERICLEASKNWRPAICFTPQKMLTKEFVIKAISLNSEVVLEIPEEMIDTDIAFEAGKYRDLLFFHSAGNIEVVKKKLIEAMSQDGNRLQEIAGGFCTAEICVAAIKQNADAIRHVPVGLLADVHKLMASERLAKQECQDS